MIGAIIGDIIGSQFEMINYTSKNMMFKDYDFHFFTDKCRPTDDTVLTIAVADAFFNKKDLPIILKEYARKYPNAGYGSSFIAWTDSDNYDPYSSYGNGSAMRVSSIPWLYHTKEDVMHHAERSAIPTHNHSEGIKGAQAIALAVFMARTGKTKEEIKSEIEKLFEYNLNRTLDEIRPNYEFNATCQGTVPEAIIAFLESEDFEDCLRKAISIGGDSDTIACMACAIAESYYGMESIRPETLNGAFSILKEKTPELHKTAMEILKSIHGN